GDGIPNYRDTDSDADGVPDWQERIFGSDPYNPNSTVAVPVGGTGAVILAISLLGALLCRKRR
ncbi:MAG: hypothetical protein NTU83_09495, partial [Candidatus Hydrogenedentes bacterium]|nr:hypothetical protein [Candidatus Hydrogenedentota bacterium]